MHCYTYKFHDPPSQNLVAQQMCLVTCVVFPKLNFKIVPHTKETYEALKKTLWCVCAQAFGPHMLALGRTLEGACAEMMK